jgi:hypothetical protein
MSSVLRHIAQVPTRTFIVTQDESSSERGPYYFLPETVEAWIASEAANMTVVGKTIVIPSADFSNVLDNLNSDERFRVRLNLQDLGTQYVIGNEVNSRLIVLRRVMNSGAISVGGGGGVVAYICIENNTSDLTGEGGRWIPRVARM